MATPHNEAKYGDIAKIVLTSGDPKRCKYITEKYLTDYKLVNSIRGMTAYTGYYKNKLVTIFPMGMGMASFGIYAYELYKFYGVETIIRMGTCGTVSDSIDVLDTLLLDASYTESNYALMLARDNETHLSFANADLNKKIVETANNMNIEIKTGIGLCNEVFDVYLNDEDFEATLNSIPSNLNIIASEMEAFALFYIANMFNKKAACLLTVVDSKKHKNKEISANDREQKLNNMIEIALETTLNL